MNLLIYVDRGVISSNGVNGAVSVDGAPGYGILGEWDVSLTLDGCLPAAFMVGLLVSSPIFAEASKHYNAFRLIAIGLGIWTLSAAGCGLSLSFWMLMLCRMAAGVGEASFVALAAPFIDDKAPPTTKTRWLAIFYLCIPTGFAAGYILGGLVAGPLGWRAAFLLEAAAMLPFLVICMFAPAIDLRGKTPGSDKKLTWRETVREFGDDFATIMRHPVYVCAIAAAAIYTGVSGVYAFMGPKACRDVFHLPPASADLVIGGVTVVTGILGTVLGGVVLDRIGSTMPNALLLCAVGLLIGCGFIIFSFAVPRSLALFIPFFAIGELGLFCIQAPMNAVALWCVPTRLRPFAMSVLIVVIHCLGDVPSPPAAGWLQDHIHNWRLTMSICSLMLLASVAVFLRGSFYARHQPDYRQQDRHPNRDSGDLESRDPSGSVDAPLLQPGAAESDDTIAQE
ncbi:hypothetical protein WJX72_004257 [[Myrmecia] bisecta]|uniref:Major facilitator superfamily (MFS) profile domain-containing protein n=1 Tax=[Myrmecia] bisecta TaxID=41462 RepID=A0AAW1PLA9_9CHLO